MRGVSDWPGVTVENVWEGAGIHITFLDCIITLCDPNDMVVTPFRCKPHYQLPDCLVVVTVSSIPVTLLAFMLHHINIYHRPTRWLLHPTQLDNTSSYTFVSQSSPRVIPFALRA